MYARARLRYIKIEDRRMAMAGTRARGNLGAGAVRPAQGLSVIVPLYNEGAGLAALHERLTQFAARLRAERKLSTEIVYVDDGSKDDTLEVARRLPQGGVDFQIVSFSRNFGKEAALRAGLDHARFDALLFMDGDGQHPPELADQLVNFWLDEGYDVV